MIEDLVSPAMSDGFHQTVDPRAGMGATEGNPAPVQQGQDQLKVIQLFDRDGGEFLDPLREFGILLKVKCTRSRLAFEMCMIHQHCGKIAEHLRQPISTNLRPEQ
jgi:hypothetical protein